MPAEMTADVGPGTTELIAVDGDNHQGPVRLEPQPPAEVVHRMMMPGTQGHEVVEVGWPTTLEPVDVVDLASIERHIACIDRTGAVHRPQGPALRPVRMAQRAAGTEHHTVRVDDDRGEGAVAHQATHGRRRQLDSRTGLAHSMVVHLARQQRADIHDHRDVGLERPDLLMPSGDETTQGLGRQSAAVHVTFDELRIAAALAVGNHRGNLTVHRTEDLGGQLGVEREAALDHSGGHVVPPQEEGLASPTTPAVDPGRLLDRVDDRADVAAELLGCGMTGHVGQERAVPEQLRPMLVGQRSGRCSQRIDVLGAHPALGQRRCKVRGPVERGCATLLASALGRRRATDPDVDIGRRSGARDGAQLGQAGRDPGLDRIEPAPHLADLDQQRCARAHIAPCDVGGTEAVDCSTHG